MKENIQYQEVSKGKPPEWPKVAIIILNWNGWWDTIECLESLQRITYPNYEVIVVDNGSAGNDADILQEKYKDYIRVIRNKENLGFSGGNNVAIEYALGEKEPPDYVFLLNNDAIIEPNCLIVCVKIAQSSRASVVGAVIKGMRDGKVFVGTPRSPLSLLGDFFVFHVLIPYRPPSSSLSFWEVGRVNGCAMSIQRELLEWMKKEYGYYLNPDYFFYGEEAEFCYLSRKHGYKVVMARDALVCHYCAKSAGLGGPLALYYFTRNKIFLASKILPWQGKLLFHLCYIATRFIWIFQELIERQPQASLAILQGLFDGYRGVKGKWKEHKG